MYGCVFARGESFKAVQVWVEKDARGKTDPTQKSFLFNVSGMSKAMPHQHPSCDEDSALLDSRRRRSLYQISLYSLSLSLAHPNRWPVIQPCIVMSPYHYYTRSSSSTRYQPLFSCSANARTRTHTRTQPFPEDKYVRAGGCRLM